MIFDKLFKKRQKTEVSLVANQSNSFGAFGGDAYSSDIYRSAIDAIARNTAKLKGSHIIKDELNKTTQSNINYLLQIQPNEIMSAYDFLYKIVTHLYIYNNAFVLIDRDESGIKGFYPINATNASLLEDSRGNLYIRLFIRDSEPIIQKYSDIIHLRRHFNSSQYFGDANDAIMNTLDLAHTQNEGLNVSIKSGANIRGIMKYEQVLPEAEMTKMRDRFIKDFLGVSNNGGVIITDSKSSFIPIESKPINIDDKQLLAIKTKIYDYLGISENIVTSKYNENEWGAFYESVIEPIATQMSLEFTRKIFTQREIRFKNYIMFESGRLQFASNSTKINLISQLIPYGLLSINQALEILNLPAVKDGDKRLQTLNVVDINTSLVGQSANSLSWSKDSLVLKPGQLCMGSINDSFMATSKHQGKSYKSQSIIIENSLIKELGIFKILGKDDEFCARITDANLTQNLILKELANSKIYSGKMREIFIESKI